MIVDIVSKLDSESEIDEFLSLTFTHSLKRTSETLGLSGESGYTKNTL